MDINLYYHIFKTILFLTGFIFPVNYIQFSFMMLSIWNGWQFLKQEENHLKKVISCFIVYLV